MITMAPFIIRVNLFTIVLSVMVTFAQVDFTFNQTYEPLWGFNHLTVLEQGKQVQLLLDPSSGMYARQFLFFFSDLAIWFHFNPRDEEFFPSPFLCEIHKITISLNIGCYLFIYFLGGRFQVDGRPIRVFSNNGRKDFFSKPMVAEASIWNGTWAGEVDWTKAPFIGQYKNFSIDGHKTNNALECDPLPDHSGKRRIRSNRSLD
ncbi:hypothetical protein RHMOL_Rhmol13G0058300 [Rhododendron molle]|uniref:Uncharacterized protein n=1 Tax=Rhododendron molle TaxID=49168 RepID=A0ACC0L4D4_RHOML|nr:hypothetical protein RHMOL_Rhmol13G0058300 [Rhododendron molle]